MKQLIIKTIELYQRIISQTNGPLDMLLGRRGNCRFFPTCSQYLRQAVTAYGIIKGLNLGLRRILRCHPFGDTGIDPVP